MRFPRLSAPLLFSLAFALILSCGSPVSTNESETKETVATPTFSLPAGELESVPATLAFSCATAGVQYHFTIDGSVPTTGSPSAASIVIHGPLTVRVIAAKSGMLDSVAASATYTVRVPDSDASLASFSYSPGALRPAFDPDVFSYELTIEAGSGSVSLSAASMSARASVSVDGGAWSTASASASLPLSDGDSFSVNVRSEDGTVDAAYTIAVREADYSAWHAAVLGGEYRDDAQWQVVLSSDGGSYYAYPTYGLEHYAYIRKSTDGGASWSELAAAGSRDWSDVRCSSSGSVVSAVYLLSGAYYYIVSVDGGATWSAPSLVNSSSPVSVAMSADGRYQFYSAHLDSVDGSFDEYDECLYRSADYGASWTAAVDFSQTEYGAGTATTYDDLYWDALVCSDDGATVVVGGYNTWNYGGIMRSEDYGVTWTETHLGSNEPIRDLTMTGDAARLACVRIFDAYVSADLGATWTEATPTISGTDYTPDRILYSRDGSALVAVLDYSGSEPSRVFVSSDHGASWSATYQNSDYSLSASVAVSANASRMLLAPGREIWESRDVGASWNRLDGIGRISLSLISLSRDGRRQLAASSLSSDTATLLTGGWVYMSHDYGASWTRVDALGKHVWSFLAVSDDGQRAVAGYYSSSSHYLSASADGGATWSAPVSVPGSTDPRGAAISSDGNVVALASGSGSRCYLSVDGGLSWTAIGACSSGYNIKAAAVSEDGLTVTIAGTNAIWTSADGGSTWTSKTFSAVSGDKSDLSDDGRTFAVSDRNGYVRLSVDGGASWSQLTVPGANASAADANKCVGVAVSPDGRGLAVITGQSAATSGTGYYATSEGSILISLDGGATWARADGAGSGVWTDIAASRGFRVLAATARETEDGPLVCR